MSHDHNHDHNSSHNHPHEHDRSHEHGHTHPHEHSHPHEHGREHDPGHGHAHTGEPGREDAQEMSLEDKLAVLLSHWVDHNDSHKDNFFSWAQKAQASGLKEIAAQLEQAGVLSEKVTLALKQAQKVLNG